MGLTLRLRQLITQLTHRVLLLMIMVAFSFQVEAGDVSTRTLCDETGNTVTLKNDRDFQVDGDIVASENLTIEGDIYTAGDITRFAYVTMSGYQTTNLTAGNEVEFDTLVEGNLPFNATTHRLTLYGNGEKAYRITFSIFFNYSGTAGYIQARVYDATNSNFISSNLWQRAESASQHQSGISTVSCIVIPSTDIDIEIQITLSNLLTEIRGIGWDYWIVESIN